MRKMFIILFMLAVCFTSAYGQQQADYGELTNTYRLMTNGGSRDWNIVGTADDTSETFRLYSCTGIQYFWSDSSGTGNDSVNIKVELLTASIDVDSAFVLAQTITSGFTTGGYEAVKLVNVAPARYGRVVVTGLTGNCKGYDGSTYGTYGQVFINGWSSQPGARGMR